MSADDQLVKCKGCPIMMAYRKGAKFHSPECRDDFFRRAPLDRSSAMWEAAREYEYPSEMDGFDWAQRAEKTLQSFLSEGARFYRLGIPRTTQDEPRPRVRWFPVALGDNSRTYLTINPFQLPHDLPLGGLYVVALYASNRTLLTIQNPFKLRFYQVNNKVAWSRGSVVP